MTADTATGAQQRALEALSSKRGGRANLVSLQDQLWGVVERWSQEVKPADGRLTDADLDQISLQCATLLSAPGANARLTLIHRLALAASALSAKREHPDRLLEAVEAALGPGPLDHSEPSTVALLLARCDLTRAVQSVRTNLSRNGT
jgi:hypothetical protein